MYLNYLILTFIELGVCRMQMATAAMIEVQLHWM